MKTQPASAQSIVDLGLDESVKYWVESSNNPMTVLVSEDGGRYEETEVNVIYKQGEVSKYPFQDASYTPFSSSPSLRFGSQGLQVVELQQQLKALGFFQHDVTGYFGDITKDAVAKFQTSIGLAVDGIAGPQTIQALEKLLNTQYAVSRVPTASNIQYVVAAPASNQIRVQPNTQYVVNSATTAPTVRYAVAAPASNQIVVPPRTETSVIPVTPSSAQNSLYSALAATPQRNVPVAATNPATALDGAKVGTELYFGSQGQIVADLQQLLQRAGKYSGPITGYFGPLTANAVKSFQSENGLPPTGIVGVKTLVVLNEVLNQ